MRSSAGRILLKASALVAALATLGPAQTPQVTGVFLMSGGGETTPLESSVGTSGHQGSNPIKAGFGVNHITQFLAIPGDRSAVRLKQSVRASILGENDHVPAGRPSLLSDIGAFVPELRLLVRKKGEREIVTSDASGVLVVTKVHDSSPKVLVNVSRQDEHTLKATPQVTLLPGEYAFNPWEDVADTTPQRYANPNAPLRYRVYCFGVD